MYKKNIFNLPAPQRTKAQNNCFVEETGRNACKRYLVIREIKMKVIITVIRWILEKLLSFVMMWNNLKYYPTLWECKAAQLF